MTVYRDRKRKTYRYDFMIAGKRYTARGFGTKRAAQDAETFRRSEVLDGRTAAFRSFGELASAYLREGDRTKSESWVKQQEWKLNKACAHWENLRPGEVTPAHVRRVLDELQDAGNGPRSLNEYRKILHAVFEFAVKIEALRRNPVKVIPRVPEPEEEEPPIPTADLRKLLVAADHEFRAFLVVQALTGARWIEVARLRWKDVHLDVDPPWVVLESRKSRSGRAKRLAQYLPAAAAAELRSLMGRAGSDWVFPGPNGQQKYQTASKRLRDLCARAGVQRYGFHSVRRWAGHAAMRMGMSNRVVARFLRHSNTAVTDRYMAVSDDLMVSVGDRLAGELADKAGSRGVNRGVKSAGDG